MRIVCMIGSLQLGGAERQLIGLASVLKESGHDVTILTYHSCSFYGRDILDKGLKAVTLKKRAGTLRLCRDIADYMRSNGCEALISFLPGASTKACIAHKFFPGFRLFVSERTMNRRLHLNDLLRFTLFREAEKVICNNYSQEDFIRKNFPELSDKLVTISNFVDTKQFSPVASRHKSQGRIVCTARVCRRKNVIGLIKAAALLKDKGYSFHIDWYGMTGNNVYYRKCIRKIGKLGLEECFRILPAAGAVADIYRDYDIFCLPSFYEGTSNSLAEAMACGLPVAVSAVGDNLLYAKDGINGFTFDPHETSGIAEVLGKALSLTGKELEEYGRRSRETALDCLSRERFRKAYASLLG